MVVVLRSPCWIQAFAGSHHGVPWVHLGASECMISNKPCRLRSSRLWQQDNHPSCQSFMGSMALLWIFLDFSCAKNSWQTSFTIDQCSWSLARTFSQILRILEALRAPWLPMSARLCCYGSHGSLCLESCRAPWPPWPALTVKWLDGTWIRESNESSTFSRLTH